MISYTPAEQAIRERQGKPPDTGADQPPAWHDQPAQAEPLATLRIPSYDATAITFAGASDVGLPDGAAQQPPAPGYAATTGPLRAIGRPAITIGDALTRDEHWGPMLTPLPCTHCRTAPPVPDGILERTRIIGHVNWLAARDGWRFGRDMDWTCPPCQQADEWKARQGQVDLHRPGPCDRHDLTSPLTFPDDDYRCTCPGAVLAVDVMLASQDYPAVTT